MSSPKTVISKKEKEQLQMFVAAVDASLNARSSPFVDIDDSGQSSNIIRELVSKRLVKHEGDGLYRVTLMGYLHIKNGMFSTYMVNHPVRDQVLKVLKDRDEPIRLSLLVEKVEIGQTALRELLNRLEEVGLVEHTIGARSTKHYAMSEEGRMLWKPME